MKKGKKVYKKFLSCVLAATMVVTSGVVYPGNEKTAEAAGGVEYSFSVDGNKWCIIGEEDGVGLLLDAQGVIYQLDENGTTVYGFGYDVATSYAEHASFFYTWDVRWDLYKQLGYPEVKNLEDFKKLVKDMKNWS